MDLDRWKNLGQEEKKKIILEKNGFQQKLTPVLEQNTQTANTERTPSLLQQSEPMPRSTRRIMSGVFLE